MKYVLGGLGVLLLVFGGLLLFGGKGTQPAAVNDSATAPAPSLLAQKLSNDGVLLDVRTPEEFAGSHIRNAVNLPLDDIQAGELPQVEKSSRLFVYCRSGNRSAQAAKALRAAGYGNVTDLGSMQSVAQLGGETVSSVCAKQEEC